MIGQDADLLVRVAQYGQLESVHVAASGRHYYYFFVIVIDPKRVYLHYSSIGAPHAPNLLDGAVVAFFVASS